MVPSVLYLIRKYFGNKFAILEILFNIFPSLIPYKYKNNRRFILVFIFIGLLVAPFLIFVVIKSWILSSSKLKQGAIIGNLDD